MMTDGMAAASLASESGAVGFEVLGACGRTEARRGRLRTRHGILDTPVFMPVGTVATVKALDGRDLEEMGAAMILANAYHLMLRPGAPLIRQMGGLHRFMGHRGAILTDSGGFQVFSLRGLRTVNDAGVRFRSHVDGALIDLTPEMLVGVQEDLGPDIGMVLDECPPANASRATVQRAMDRTTRWARRCLAARGRDDVAWFGIVQGALFEDLRTQHAQAIGELPFDGLAIGGVSVGELPEEIDRIVRFTAPLLPAHKPRYLMGVGTPQDLVRGVAAGLDMFDCVLPTRNARNGNLFTSAGRLAIKNAKHRQSDRPVDERCGCRTCKTVSRAYLRHLYTTKEITYHRLATIHNVTFYLELMATVRAALDGGQFDPEGLLEALDADDA